MSTHFESFISLPAELRTTIWRFALQQEQGNGNCTGRQIELYHYHPEIGNVSIAISRPYPTVFAVSREARYESARAMNCQWAPVYPPDSSTAAQSHKIQFVVCFNFKLDTVSLRTRFLAPPLQVLLPGLPTPEQYRLEVFARLLKYETLQCIESIVIDAQPPARSCRLDLNAWWKGEGLEIFSFGRLETVTVITRERSENSSRDYPRWLEAAVRDEVHDRWAERGETYEPRVEVVSV
ncbi:hypothetical protein SVAN01_03836 [Stagonosporopsis vannaccii]|nr:hypothetical protein SVAN01_03836 [Stagonosporopsis vannaccii]